MRTFIFLLFVALVGACGVEEHDRPKIPESHSSFSVTAEASRQPDPAQSEAFDQLLADMTVLLPYDAVRADVMTLQISERGQGLVTRFKTAISQKPEWWVEYSKQAMPGRELPFHPNMGLSEEEYAEMGELLERMTMRKAGESTVVFVREDGLKVAISSIELADVLENIVVDFENDWVDTPFGRLDTRDDVMNDDPNAPTGPWSGPSWKLEQPADQEPFGTAVTFALGRRTYDQRGVLYYKVRQILPDEPPQKIDLFLLYDDPAEE